MTSEAETLVDPGSTDELVQKFRKRGSVHSTREFPFHIHAHTANYHEISREISA